VLLDEDDEKEFRIIASTAVSRHRSEVSFAAGGSSVRSGTSEEHELGILGAWVEAEQQYKKSLNVGRSLIIESSLTSSVVPQAPKRWSGTPGPGIFLLDDMIRNEPKTSVQSRWTPARLIMSPSSTRRVSWDLLSMVMVLYDVISLPLQLFEQPPTLFDFYMSWMTRLFWTVDVPLNLLTGFLRGDGFLEMRFREIAKAYLKTWCVLDVVIVLVDWLELIWGVSTGQTYMRMGKASRAIRLARLIRLLRVSRIFSVATSLAESMQSERATIAIELSKPLFAVLGWSHFTACLWYGLGAYGREAAMPNWIDDTQIHDRSFAYTYLTSAHWAISQFTGGMDEVKPLNAEERLYAIATYMCGFVVSAAFASILTSSMTRLHLLANGQSQQLSLLRRYLLQNKIPRKLCVRIQRNANMAMQAQHIPDSMVTLLQTVSRPLQVELHREMHFPVLDGHAFFCTYEKMYPYSMREACHTCAVVETFSPGDEVFHTGERDSECRIFFVRDGQLEYTHLNGHKDDIPPGEYVSEASLWLDWTHRGSLVSKDEDTSVLEFSGLKFKDVVRRYEHHALCPWAYAKKFLEKAKVFEELSDIMVISPSLILEELSCVIPMARQQPIRWPFTNFA